MDQLERLKFLTQAFGPVSYTHLDVYKRQAETNARGCPLQTAGNAAANYQRGVWGTYLHYFVIQKTWEGAYRMLPPKTIPQFSKK